MARLYADEDVPFSVVELLRQLGHDVVTTFEAGRANQSIEDADQLAFATKLDGVILTRNRRDFIALHRRFTHHAGIISITDDPDLNGQARRIDQALNCFGSLSNQHLRVNRPSTPAQP